MPAVGQFKVVKVSKPNSSQVLGSVAFFDETGAPIDLGGGGNTAPIPMSSVTGLADALAGKIDKSAIHLGVASDLAAGTGTASAVWSAKIIHDEIARQIAAIPKP